MSHCGALLSSYWMDAVLCGNLLADVEVDRRKVQWCTTNKTRVADQWWALALVACAVMFVTPALRTCRVADDESYNLENNNIVMKVTKVPHEVALLNGGGCMQLCMMRNNINYLNRSRITKKHNDTFSTPVPVVHDITSD